MMRQVSVWHVYGGFQDQSETITCSVQNTWYPITNAGNNLWVGTEANGFTLSSDVMTATNGGDYFGHVAITLSGSLNKDFEARVYNITQTRVEGYHSGITTTGANNYAQISIPLYIEATAGDQLRMEIRCTSNPVADPTLQHSVFYISYLHD